MIMPAVDLKLDELRNYKPELTKQGDFDEFWDRTLAEAAEYPLNPKLVPHDYPIKEVEVFNAYYDGYKGAQINGWYILPRNRDRKTKLPVIVHYHGYTGNKGQVHEFLKWTIQGYAVLSVNARGQGGATPDPAVYSQGGITGWMTLGILDKEQYYYRGAYIDCVRALDFVCGREEIDAGRIGLYGGSQGGGLTIAVAALDSRPKFAMPIYPYLCHYRRALEMYQEGPYREFFDYFRRFDPEMKTEEAVFETLSYFDGMNLAPRIKCPVLMAATLRDLICPPSTQFAAYNHIKSEKELKLYPHHGHETLSFHDEAMIAYARKFME